MTKSESDSCRVYRVWEIIRVVPITMNAINGEPRPKLVGVILAMRVNYCNSNCSHKIVFTKVVVHLSLQENLAANVGRCTLCPIGPT